MKVVDLLNYDGIESVHSLPNDISIKLSEVSKIIFKSKRSTLLTGAGISCNAGIPDFRSSDGLYNLVKEKYPKTVVKGQDLFDISLFRDELTLQVFCTFMEGLYSSSIKAIPTETHKFIRTLKEKNKLLRCYTQNIDGIEAKIDLNTGVKMHEFNTDSSNQRLINSNFNKSWKNLDVVQLHGDLNQLSCTQCYANFNWTEKYQIMLSNGDNPECTNCIKKFNERLYQGKRLTGNIGMLRPGIVLYGENHPQAEILAQGLNTDIKLKPDLLIIMGTSLKVDGVKKLVKTLAHSIHERGGKVIFINKTSLSSSQWENYIDYQILTDCDNFVRILKQEIPDLFLTQEQLDSKRLKTLELKKIKQEERKVKQEERKVKQEERKIKQEQIRIKQEQIKVKQEFDNGLLSIPVKQETTPPNTPKKVKRPVLKRKSSNGPEDQSKRPKLNFDLPSPPTSFTSDVTVAKQDLSI